MSFQILCNYTQRSSKNAISVRKPIENLFFHGITLVFRITLVWALHSLPRPPAGGSVMPNVNTSATALAEKTF